MMEKKAFTGGLSTDRDSAYIQPNQYLNALNIRVASTEDGTAGALSNVKGNTKVALIPVLVLLKIQRTLVCFTSYIIQMMTT